MILLDVEFNCTFNICLPNKFKKRICDDKFGERSISILFYLDENKVHTHSWNKITVNSNVYVLWSDLSKINSCNKVVTLSMKYPPKIKQNIEQA